MIIALLILTMAMARDMFVIATLGGGLRPGELFNGQLKVNDIYTIFPKFLYLLIYKELQPVFSINCILYLPHYQQYFL